MLQGQQRSRKLLAAAEAEAVAEEVDDKDYKHCRYHGSTITEYNSYILPVCRPRQFEEGMGPVFD